MAARAPKQELKDVVAKVAKANGKDVTAQGKLVRSYIRRNRDSLAKVWPALNQHGKGDAYGNVPKRAADRIIEALTK